MHENTITYVSNAGVLLWINGNKILIDALTTPGNEIYKDTSAELERKILGGCAPFDQIDLFLITHHHKDHFNAELTYQCLLKNKDLRLISTPEVVKRVLSVGTQDVSEQCDALDLPLFGSVSLTCKGIDMTVFRTLHDGEGYASVQNLMFFIHHGLTVAHLGDSAPDVKNFQGVKSVLKGRVDVLIENFPLIAIPFARRLIQAHLAPQKIVVVHLPDPQKPGASWTTLAKKSYERVKHHYVPMVMLEDVGVEILI